MAEGTRTRALLAGLAALCLVSAEGALLAAVAFLLALFTDVRLAAGAYRYGIDAAVELLLGLGMLAAGYVAASRLERHKVRAGLLLAVVALLLSIGIGAPVALLSEGMAGQGRGTGHWAEFLGTLVLPVLGALLQSRRGERGRPVPLPPVVALVACYDILLIGGLLAALAFLTVGYYRGSWGPFAAWQMWLFAALLLLPPACAVYLLRNRGGLVRRLVKQPAAWACLAAVAWFAFCFVRSERANQWDPTEIRSLVTQINERNKIPDDKNGAALVLQAADAMEKLDRPSGNQPSGIWDPTQQPAWSGYLAQAQGPIALARRAADMPIFYRVTYSDEKTAFVDDLLLQPVRGVCNAMLLQARLADVGCGDSLGWLDDALRISAPLRLRNGIGGLVAFSLAGGVCGNLRDVLDAKHPDAAQLLRADGLLKDWEKAEKPDVETECLGARLDAAMVLQEMYIQESDKLAVFLDLHIFDKRYVARLASREIEPFCADLRTHPIYQVRLLHPVGPLFLFLSSMPGTSDPFEKVDAAFANMFAGGTGRSLAAYLGAVAQMHMLRAYIAAERMYAAAGRLPSGWQDLVPAYLDAVPDDPFTGAPLYLRPADGGVSFSSVGPDGQDAGGQGFFTSAERDAAEKQGTKPDGIRPDLPDDVALVFHSGGRPGCASGGATAMSHTLADRVTAVFAGLGMAALTAVHLAFLAGVAAAAAAMLPVGVGIGVLASPWPALAGLTMSVAYGGFWAARGGQGRWWPSGIAVGTLAAALALAAWAATLDVPGAAEGGLVLVLCESAALAGAAVGRRSDAGPAAALIGRVVATDSLLLSGAIFLVCVTVAAGYPGEFKNLTRAEAWVLALLSGLPVLGSVLALRATGGVRSGLLRRATGVAVLLLLACAAVALGVRACANERGAARLREAVAGFNAAHAATDGAAVEAVLTAARQVEVDLATGGRPDIVLAPAGWTAATEPDLARELDGLRRPLAAAVSSAEALAGYLPLAADMADQPNAQRQRQAQADALIQALCASALRADVGYAEALARLDAAERIAIALTPQAVLTQTRWGEEHVVLVSLKRLLAARPLDAQGARDAVALLAEWDKRRQAGAATWGALARVAAVASSVRDYARSSRQSVLSYLAAFWMPPAARQAAADKALAAFTADVGRMRPAPLIGRYGGSAYLSRVLDELVSRLAGHSTTSEDELRGLSAEAASIASVVDGMAASWSDAARLRLLAAALAMRLEEQRTGRLPEKLEAVAAGCPVPLQDPFSDGLLSLTVLDGRIVLFSVGPDGARDAGQGAFSPLEGPAGPPTGEPKKQPDNIVLPLDAVPPLAR